jgi:hypothetical protein
MFSHALYVVEKVVSSDKTVQYKIVMIGGNTVMLEYSTVCAHCRKRGHRESDEYPVRQYPYVWSDAKMK